jgi:hypothetical protein
VSTDPGLTGASTTALSGGSGTRAITGLTASTRYYWRIRLGSPGYKYAATGQFWTGTAPVGNGTLTVRAKGITNVATLRVDYGTSSGSLSSNATASCTANAQCIVPVTTSKGLIYYQIKQLDGGSATLQQSPVLSAVVR